MIGASFTSCQVSPFLFFVSVLIPTVTPKNSPLSWLQDRLKGRVVYSSDLTFKLCQSAIQKLVTRFPLRIPGVGHGQGSVDQMGQLGKRQIGKQTEYKNQVGKIHGIGNNR